MTKISVFIESKSGEVLGEVISFKDKISVGSGEDCSICLKNCKFAELENEIYFLNGECWLQVGKDGAPVTFMGKQHRSVKITQSSQFHLRDVILKVILDSIPEFESEATKIVNETMSENSDKTRIVSQNEPTLEVAMPLTELADSEATRVVSEFEQTKVQAAPDFSSDLTVVELATPVQDEDTLTNTKIPSRKPQPNLERATIEQKNPSQLKSFFSRQDFSQVQLKFQELLNRFQIKERIFPILGVLFIVIAGLIFVTRENKVTSTESLAKSQERIEKLPESSKALTAKSGTVVQEGLSSTTKDGYLNDMSNLFE